MKKCLVILAACIISGAASGQFDQLARVRAQDVIARFRFDDKVVLALSDRIVETDGTQTGTRVAATFQQGKLFVQSAEKLFFLTSVPSGGDQLQIYAAADGSTTLLKKFEQVYLNNTVTAENGTLYFFVYSSGQLQLWQSDGTAAGTAIIAGPGLDDFNSPIALTSLNNKLLLANTTAGNDDELWSIDLYVPSAVLLAGPDDNFQNPLVQGHARAEGTIYFGAYTDSYGYELWKSDGTKEGTRQVADLLPGVTGSGPLNFTAAGEKIYFTTGFGAALMKLDPLSDEITLVDSCRVSEHCYRNLMAIGDKVVFAGKPDSGQGIEPWVSDGTPAGTTPAADIWSGLRSSIADGTVFHDAAGAVVFSADDGISGEELWMIDSSNLTAMKAFEFRPGPAHSGIVFAASVGNKLVISAKEGDEENLYAADISVISPKGPEAVSRIPAETWFQTMGPEPSVFGYFYQAFNYDMALTSDNGIIVSGAYDGSRLNFFDNNYFTPWNFNSAGKSTAFISRFTIDGRLEWTRRTNTTELLYRKNSSVATDHQGNIFFATGMYASDELIDLQSSAGFMRGYIARFDGDGNQVWLKTVTAPGGMLVSNLVADNAGDIFMSGLFFGFSYRSGDTGLASEISPAYFVQKTDRNGNTLWIKEIENESDTYGEITDMKFDPVHGRLVLLISSATRYTISDCQLHPWKFQVVVLNLSGEEIWKREYTTSDLSSANALAVLTDGDILVAGRFRGSAEFEQVKLRTDPGNTCHVFTSFLLRLNRDGKVISAISGNPRDIDPYDIEVYSGGYLISGTEARAGEEPGLLYGEVYPDGSTVSFVRAYDYGGNLVSERVYKKHVRSPAPSHPLVELDGGQRVILSDRAFGKYDTISYSGGSQTTLNIVLLRTQLGQFTGAGNTENIADGVQVYPNPADDRVFVKIWREQFPQQNFGLEILDTRGRILLSTPVPESADVMSVDLSSIDPGLYLFRIKSSQKQITRRVVVRK